MSESNDQLQLKVALQQGEFRLAVDTEIPLHGVTGLFGPSGSGKSTLLRVIAGLQRNASGTVRVNGRVWQDRDNFVAAHRRPIGLVFQGANLFSHLNVSGNLEYASRRCFGEKNIVYDEVVSAFDLGNLVDRDVSTLSGGEQQRVAIARTLLSNPKLLLLDEPLAALDVGRKRNILPYIESLYSRFGIPVLYVSHSVEEVARLADRVAIIEAGRITSQGDTGTILNRESSGTSSLSFETVSILTVTVTEFMPELQLMRVAHNESSLTLPVSGAVELGDRLRLSIRAGDVVLATSRPQGLSVRNVLPGTVQEIRERAADAFGEVRVDVGGAQITAQLTRYAIQEMHLSPGQDTYVLLKTAVFDRAL